MYGDRTPYYQHPMTYQQGYTKLTPLGQMQELQLGSYLRSEYLNPTSANVIAGLQADVVDDRQLLVRADNGGEGGAIVDSSVALLQGLFPPTPRSRTGLANGTTVVGPMGGYQYIPIESVEPIQSIQLEGWTSCPNFEKHVKDFYNSPGFKKKAEEAAPFLNAVKPYIFGIDNTLENMIYDYLHTNYIHNETYAFRLPPTFLQQAQYWVDYHEHGVFTDVANRGIGNVAGRTVLPSIISALERINNADDPLRLVIQEVSYKPLISLFNITNVTARYPELDGLPTYASALALELRDNEEGETFIRAKFKNGTSDFEEIHLFSHRDDIALNELLYRLDLTSIGSTAHWCRVCGQRSARGCNICNREEYDPSIATLVSTSNESCIQRIAGALSSPSAQLISAVLFACLAFLGLYKLYAARSGTMRLRGGYDPLPTSAQYVDEPAMTKGRGRF
ncbi:phosphoglycerate mutase-like protein [Fomitiporia mediterranea MF3/22]|uniref:phosphoglycerate mutase-like protein n=1 Tax=Fomitiporia mediterranea (strain MF3/22) TaxID=694068 RepID=UPI00044080C9|nr:phosphoglycerate mutase-like protein [Fomitiporia mediterranea MF3/22]EJD08254.1 phosphoglycerate mutase-like protein [Fomitiporia mediterranea MF3/22]